MSDDTTEWLDTRPDISSVRLAAVDLNGIARGKRIPVNHAEKAFGGGVRMPLSALNVDIWGEDIHDSPLVFESGDADGTLLPTERGFVPLDWFGTPSALLPLWMSNDNGTAFSGDPRHALKSVLNRYEKLRLTPVAATEMEFYLLDGKQSHPAAPLSPLTGRPVDANDVLSLAGIDEFDAFFTDLYAACAVMNIPADAAISEGGLGQFEINLMHVNDALKAADDAWLFKQAVHGVARQHGFAASFMAKPYPNQPGNGLHAHFSILDKDGQNIFDNGTDEGSDALRHAVGGLLAAMQASTLMFAPHFNSYRRMAPNSHAPTSVTWGYENRTAAVRIPGGNSKARRIEHRVAGGDCNPYLMLSAVLGAALVGMEEKIEPAEPIVGNGYESGAPSLPTSWDAAISEFESDETIAKIFPAELIMNFVLCKRQELARFEGQSEEFEFTTYLESV